jgi:ribosomal protein S27AE
MTLWDLRRICPKKQNAPAFGQGVFSGIAGDRLTCGRRREQQLEQLQQPERLQQPEQQLLS